MRPVHPTQIDRLRQETIAVLDLVHIRTFTTRDTAQVLRNYYLSSFGVTFGGETYRGWLLRVGELVSRMSHVQALGTGLGSGLSREFEIEVYNGDLSESVTFWTDFMSANPMTAEIEYSQLLLDNPTDDDWTDVPPVSGEEYRTVLFRGELEEGLQASETSFTLRFKSTLPEMRWKYPPTSGGDPRHRGHSLPVVFGTADSVRAIHAVTDASPLESIVHAYPNYNTLKLSARSSSGTMTDVSGPATFREDTTVSGVRGSVSTAELTSAEVSTIASSIGDQPPDAGYNLDLFAKVMGCTIPTADTNYQGSAGEVVTYLPDIFRFIVEELRNNDDPEGSEDPVLARLSVDATNMAELETALGTLVFDLILNTLGDGDTLESILAHLAYEAGVNVFLAERNDGTYLMVKPMFHQESGWPNAVVTLEDGEWQDLSATTKGELAQRTRFLFLWNWYAHLGGAGSRDAYISETRVDEDLNDLDTDYVPASILTEAQNRLGKRDHPAILLRAIRSSDTAKRTAGILARSSFQNAVLYQLVGVPHPKSWRLELGDIIQFTPPITRTPTLVGGIPVKGRILETVRRPDGAMDLVCAEVVGIRDQVQASITAHAQVYANLSDAHQVRSHVTAHAATTAALSFTLGPTELRGALTAVADMSGEIEVGLRGPLYAVANALGTLQLGSNLSAAATAAATVSGYLGALNMIGGFQFTRAAGPWSQDVSRCSYDCSAGYLFQVGSTWDFANVWTLSWWINSPSFMVELEHASQQSDIEIICGAMDIQVKLWDTGGTLFQHWNFTAPLDQAAGAAAERASRWRMQTVTWDGTNLRAYQDGVELTGSDTVDNAGSQSNSSRLIKLGSGSTSRLHSFAMWSTALSGNAIRTIHNHGAGSYFNLDRAWVDYTTTHRAALKHWYRPGRDPQKIGRDFPEGASSRIDLTWST